MCKSKCHWPKRKEKKRKGKKGRRKKEEKRREKEATNSLGIQEMDEFGIQMSQIYKHSNS